MDIIYSRKRIKLPNFDKKYIKKIIKIAIIIMIAVFTSSYIMRSITPIFEEICDAEAKSIATTISNEQATEVMNAYTYDELVNILKDSSGNITSIQTNVIKINEIISDVAIKIQEKFDNLERKEVGIAIGTFTGSKILSGRGPKIKYRINSIGDVETDFRSEFKQSGINQTLHRIYLQVDCNVTILTPFSTIKRKISNQVILAENIIVGEIPNTYYNLEGLESNKDTLEVLE